jgi:hypothetical protein
MKMAMSMRIADEINAEFGSFSYYSMIQDKFYIGKFIDGCVFLNLFPPKIR